MADYSKKAYDRRRYKRQNYYCLLKYKGTGAAGTYAESLTSLRNISGGGILFKEKRYIPVGTEIQMKINIPFFDKTVNTVARVVRYQKDKRGNYQIGAEFLNIAEGDRKRIEEFINNLK